MTPQDARPVLLVSGEIELLLVPAVGGGVFSLRRAGVHLLRPGREDALARRDPLGLAAFPLFPFSGRIDHGRFEFEGRSVALAPNFPPEPHAIHGQAWQNPWEVVEADGVTATLRYVHEADDWPWRYVAEQHFAVRDDGIDLTLSLTNLAEEAMPAGIGWHPYFPRKDALIAADVGAFWPSGDDMIPGAPVALDSASDLGTARPVADLHVDNGYDARPDTRTGTSRARIEWPHDQLVVELEAGPEFGFWVVYTPDEADFFCIEPISHAPDALNSALPAHRTGARRLAPSEALFGHVALRVENR